jgi:iron complex outermembrane receptor protein
VLLGLLLPLPLLAQSTGTLRGTVTDSENGDPLPGASIIVLGTNVGVVTGLDGTYRLVAPSGSREVQVSFVGFRTQRRTVSLQTGTTTTENFALEPDLVGVDEVVVIGTRRQDRTVVDSPVPVDVISPAEIQSSGFSETTQILQLVVPSYNAPQPSITDGTDHVRPATLRGLGPDQVLLLVNGKRRHTSALVHVNGSVGRGSTGVDMNAIPSSAIDRIEVLRDGAAAQYGSDAIAGVINVILKDHEGLDASVTYGQYYSTDLRGYTENDGNRPGTGTNGQPLDTPSSFAWDNPSETEGARIGAPEEVTYDDGQTVNAHLGYGLRVGGDGSFYVSGQVRHRDFVNRAGLDPRTQYFTGDPRETTINRLNHRYGNGSFDEFSLFFNGSKPLRDGQMQVYTFGGASARDGLTGCFFRRANDNRTNRTLYPDGFLPKINAQVNDLSASAGLKGRAAGWNYDLSETVGQNRFRFDMTDTHNASMGNSSPTAFDSGTLGFAQATTNLDLFRAVEVGTASPLSVAFGAEFRLENYQIDQGDEASYLNGGVAVLDGPNAGQTTAAGAQCFPGFSPRNEQDRNRTNVGLYLDVENNLTSQLLLSAAARFENYSDFGATLTGKVAGRFEFVEGLALRGAVSTGFRAPSLAQAWFTSIATNFIGGVPFEVGTFPVDDPVARALGAQDLDPETSVNLSAGVTFARKNLSVTVDAFQIDINDRITFTENFTGTAITNFLAAQGIAGANGGRYFTNAIDTQTRGLDIIARYGQRLGPGNARFTAAVNFNETEVTNVNANGVIPAPQQLIDLGQPNLVGRLRVGDYELAQPKNKLNLQTNYDLRAWRFMVRLNRYGEVTEINAEGDPTRDQTFPSAWITDAEFAYSLRQGLSLALGANNLFDVYPEKRFKINSFSGITPYSGFSPFGFFGRYIYTRLNVNL